ncbi:MAG TPA: molybdopterin-guanine dinucleotide biosynthesis protein MobB [Myxococcaceae bacterium]
MTIPALSIIGWSGTGKTTLIEELLRRFRARGMRVLAVKHSAHAHAPRPGPDTDTARFLAAGAAEARLVASGASVELPDGGFDLALVEGWKGGPLPKLEVWREGLERPLTADPLVLAPSLDLDAVAQRALSLAIAGLPDPPAAPAARPLTAERSVPAVRFIPSGGGAFQLASEAPDTVAVEEPLEIRISGDSLAVTMRTPGDDLDLAVGFLFAEGLIHGASDLGSVAHCGRPDDEGYGNLVEVTPAPGVHIDLEKLDATRRGTLTTSACGVCGRRSVDDLLSRVGQVPPGGPPLSAHLIASAPDLLRREQRAFARTGGTHGAAIFDLRGRLLSVAEDVGRHNAVDKAIGALVRRGLIATAPPLGTLPPPPTPDDTPTLLVVSGRASFEIVQKAAAAKLPIIAAVGAGSSLAVDLARRAGIALCTFVRGGTFNVYSRPDRIAGAPPLEP